MADPDDIDMQKLANSLGGGSEASGAAVSDVGRTARAWKTHRGRADAWLCRVLHKNDAFQRCKNKTALEPPRWDARGGPPSTASRVASRTDPARRGPRREITVGARRYDHSDLENRMERWDRRSKGSLFREARSRYRPTREAMGRLERRGKPHPGVMPEVHDEKDYARRAIFYEDMHRTLHHRALAEKLLVEDGPPPSNELMVAPPSIEDESVETRFTVDPREAALRRAERWVARPLGPQPRAPWRVVVLVADCGLGYAAAELAGSLEGVAEVSALCPPGRGHRAAEGVGEGPEVKYPDEAVVLTEEEKREARRKSFLAAGTDGEAAAKPKTDLQIWGAEARDALYDLGFFRDPRPWLLIGHGLGAIVAHQLALAEAKASGKRHKRSRGEGERRGSGKAKSSPQGFTY